MTNTVMVATVDGSKKRNRLTLSRADSGAVDADRALKFALLQFDLAATQW